MQRLIMIGSGIEQSHLNIVTGKPVTLKKIMAKSHEETMAKLANDLFTKRQRLIKAGQPGVEILDERTARAMEAEYRTAELEYQEAKAAFARAMHAEKRSAA
jgi:hypothetical protein